MPLRVLCVVRPADGGMWRHVQSVCGGLDPALFEVRLAAPPAAAAGDAPEAPFDPLPATWGVTIPDRLDPLRLARAAATLRRVIRAFRPHVVHAHGFKAALAARLACAGAGCPVVYTIHGWPGPAAGAAAGGAGRGLLLRCGERALAPLTSRYVAVSRRLAQYLISDLGVPAGRVRVIYNGVDARRFSPAADGAAVRRAAGVPADALCVGMAGRLAPEKGVEEFVAAAARVAPAWPAARFICAGDGPLAGRLRDQAAHLGLSDRLTFLGHRRDMPQFYAALDVFVAPSRSEGMGLGVLEAMAAGRAVVASDVGGVAEAVTAGQDGVLVPPGDGEALAMAIAALLANPGQRRRLGRAARHTAEGRFGIGRAVAATAALYDEVCGERRWRPLAAPGAGRGIRDGAMRR